jgi:hypothetical protein
MGWLWHKRLGHVGMKKLNRLVKHDLVLGLKDVKFEKDKLCSACQTRKQVANSHPNKSITSSTTSIWIYLVPLPIEVLVEIPIVL